MIRVVPDIGGSDFLYSEFDKEDPAFSRFMYGLYYFRQNRPGKGREYFYEALRMDDKLKNLGPEYRNIIICNLRGIPAAIRQASPAIGKQLQAGND